MPTDGADFGRRVYCYGKVYTAAKQGATPEEIAQLAITGAERDIRRDKGVPVFKDLVHLLMQVTHPPNDFQLTVLLRKTEELRATFAEHSLSRSMIDAAEKIGVACINANQPITPHEASSKILDQFIKGRCCDPMNGYITRHRTHSFAVTRNLIRAIGEQVAVSNALHDLSGRMLNASNAGLPEKASRPKPITHSAVELGNFVVGSI